MVRTAVICAAGLGSRLGYDKPKCLVDIGEHKLIYYILNALRKVEEIRIVVGFKEEEVIDTVRQIRNDVIFVRNPDFKNTTNSYSLFLGSYDLKHSFLTVDGDMILDFASINAFMEKCENGKNLIGITSAKTEDAVFVKLDQTEGQVIGFSREKISDFEWSGIAHLEPGMIRKSGRYVYQELEPHLPFECSEIDCFEIDTPEDLYNMRKKIHTINLHA